MLVCRDFSAVPRVDAIQECVRICADMESFGHSGARVPEIRGGGLIARGSPISKRSQGSGRGEPDTLEAQARVLCDQVVVAVVVQDTRAGLVRASSEHDVDRR